ncbi:Mn2+/Fe2+ transporter [Peribacillus cavernae]|uniref:Mn2+/Fe2+ transporter n=1 Tax=Peribacillus cavernae TaxID=1674310 RepID=A0A433HWR0_9BACI|nr:Nramp family divalent metal transporter [Peribacillus cavernae]MDQ0218118.1 Mn2+/Fe2+ NRAMP family transporter [Peribacillus cavernae]RUQ32727.1 Mn2+/Fe2+ transporter [Peribacillus cavernae]
MSDTNLKPEISPRIQPKKNIFKEVMKSYGPGIIAVLSWLGAGDLVNASISGANYGYALMWVLALSLLIRFVITNIMSRYQLCNNEGLTILEGFTKLHRFYPYFLGAYALIMAHLFNSYMIKGVGEVFAWLFHFGHPFMWSIIAVLTGVFVIGKDIYNSIENLMKVLLAIMTFSFIGLAIWSTPDVGGILKGTIGFSIPKDEGFYGAFLMAVSLTGAVAGSIANFLYPYFMKDKGWISPIHKRLQRNDLLFAIIMAIVINLSIWIVGAEILRPNGIQVNTIGDLADALSLHLGYVGSLIFYLGVFGALYSSIIGFAAGFPKLIIDSIHKIKPERREKFGEKLENDPWFKWFSLFILISPLIWSVPGAPGFVSLVVFVNILSVVGLPVISVGLLILSNQKKLLGKYTNNWFENILLTATTILAIYSSITLAQDIISKL